MSKGGKSTKPSGGVASHAQTEMNMAACSNDSSQNKCTDVQLGALPLKKTINRQRSSKHSLSRTHDQQDVISRNSGNPRDASSRQSLSGSGNRVVSMTRLMGKSRSLFGFSPPSTLLANIESIASSKQQAGTVGDSVCSQMTSSKHSSISKLRSNRLTELPSKSGSTSSSCQKSSDCPNFSDMEHKACLTSSGRSKRATSGRGSNSSQHQAGKPRFKILTCPTKKKRLSLASSTPSFSSRRPRKVVTNSKAMDSSSSGHHAGNVFLRHLNFRPIREPPEKSRGLNVADITDYQDWMRTHASSATSATSQEDMELSNLMLWKDAVKAARKSKQKRVPGAGKRVCAEIGGAEDGDPCFGVKGHGRRTKTPLRQGRKNKQSIEEASQTDDSKLWEMGRPQRSEVQSGGGGAELAHALMRGEREVPDQSERQSQKQITLLKGVASQEKAEEEDLDRELQQMLSQCGVDADDVDAKLCVDGGGKSGGGGGGSYFADILSRCLTPHISHAAGGLVSNSGNGGSDNGLNSGGSGSGNGVNSGGSGSDGVGAGNGSCFSSAGKGSDGDSAGGNRDLTGVCDGGSGTDSGGPCSTSCPAPTSSQTNSSEGGSGSSSCTNSMSSPDGALGVTSRERLREEFQLRLGQYMSLLASDSPTARRLQAHLLKQHQRWVARNTENRRKMSAAGANPDDESSADQLIRKDTGTTGAAANKTVSSASKGYWFDSETAKKLLGDARPPPFRRPRSTPAKVSGLTNRRGPTPSLQSLRMTHTKSKTKSASGGGVLGQKTEGLAVSAAKVGGENQSPVRSKPPLWSTAAQTDNLPCACGRGGPPGCSGSSITSKSDCKSAPDTAASAETRQNTSRLPSSYLSQALTLSNLFGFQSAEDAGKPSSFCIDSAAEKETSRASVRVTGVDCEPSSQDGADVGSKSDTQDAPTRDTSGDCAPKASSSVEADLARYNAVMSRCRALLGEQEQQDLQRQQPQQQQQQQQQQKGEQTQQQQQHQQQQKGEQSEQQQQHQLQEDDEDSGSWTHVSEQPDGKDGGAPACVKAMPAASVENCQTEPLIGAAAIERLEKKPGGRAKVSSSFNGKASCNGRPPLNLKRPASNPNRVDMVDFSSAEAIRRLIDPRLTFGPACRPKVKFDIVKEKHSSRRDGESLEGGPMLSPRACPNDEKLSASVAAYTSTEDEETVRSAPRAKKTTKTKGRQARTSLSSSRPPTPKSRLSRTSLASSGVAVMSNRASEEESTDTYLPTTSRQARTAAKRGTRKSLRPGRSLVTQRADHPPVVTSRPGSRSSWRTVDNDSRTPPLEACRFRGERRRHPKRKKQSKKLRKKSSEVSARVSSSDQSCLPVKPPGVVSKKKKKIKKAKSCAVAIESCESSVDARAEDTRPLSVLVEMPAKEAASVESQNPGNPRQGGDGSTEFSASPAVEYVLPPSPKNETLSNSEVGEKRESSVKEASSTAAPRKSSSPPRKKPREQSEPGGRRSVTPSGSPRRKTASGEKASPKNSPKSPSTSKNRAACARSSTCGTKLTGQAIARRPSRTQESHLYASSVKYRVSKDLARVITSQEYQTAQCSQVGTVSAVLRGEVVERYRREFASFKDSHASLPLPSGAASKAQSDLTGSIVRKCGPLIMAVLIQLLVQYTSNAT